jgi:hypothetical protein
MEKSTADRLFDELKNLVKDGLRRRPESLQLPMLDHAAEALSKYPTGSPARKLKDVLETAAGRLVEARRNAAAALLDFGAEPGAAKPEARRLAASEALGLASAEAFRKEREDPLLKELATQLAGLLAEHDEPEATAPSKGASVQTAPAPSDAPSATPGSHARAMFRSRPHLWIAVAILAALAAGLVLLLPHSHPGQSPQQEALELKRAEAKTRIPNDCAKTTAERFDPGLHTHRLQASYQLYMYVPHQIAPGTKYGWAHFLEYHNHSITHEVIHTAEVREFALSYHNYSQHPANGVIAVVALPAGSQLLSESVCLYRNGNYAEGTRYTSENLAQSGQSIGDYAPGTSAYVTFLVRLPDVLHLGCGLSEVTLAGKAGTENPIYESDWIGNASDVTLNFERRCHP